MPTLDVSRVFRNPRFREPFTLIRRKRITVKGVGEVTEEPVEMQGVIQPMNTKELERLNEGDWRKGGINVWAIQPKFEINTDATLPDEVIFENNRYMVTSVEDWTHYGRGYMKVSALLVLNEGESGYDSVNSDNC